MGNSFLLSIITSSCLGAGGCTGDRTQAGSVLEALALTAELCTRISSNHLYYW